MRFARRDELQPYVTRDGSEIREWAGPGYRAPAESQSLAEATVAPGESTAAHWHREAEEIYLVTPGEGLVRVGEEERRIRAGDAVVIPPGEVHLLSNTGAADLVVACASSPPYLHDDTFLVEGSHDSP